jgi:hypothetical protein
MMLGLTGKVARHKVPPDIKNIQNSKASNCQGTARFWQLLCSSHYNPARSEKHKKSGIW